MHGNATIEYPRNAVPPDTHPEIVVLSKGIARKLIIERFAFENGAPKHHVAPIKLLESSFDDKPSHPVIRLMHSSDELLCFLPTHLAIPQKLPG